MDEVLQEAADAAGIEYNGAVAQPEPELEASRNEMGDYLFTLETLNGEFYRFKCIDVGFVRAELQCRLSVQYKKHKGDKPRTLLSRKRWIFESNSSTSQLFTELNRWKAIIANWPALLTQISSWFEGNFETGDPFVWLDEVEDPGPLSYLLDPLIQDGEHTLVGARGGSLKSMTALAACLSLATGTSIIPGLNPRRKVKSLYIDYETNASTHKRRLLQIAKAKGLNIPPGMIGYKRLSSPLVQLKTELRQLVKLQEVELIVVDSVGRAVGGETVGEADVQAYYNAISGLDVTCMSIGHTSKSSAETVAGNAQWEFQARSMWIFEAAKEHGSNAVVVGMHHRKVNEGELLPSLNYAVTFGDGAVSYATAETEDVQQLHGVDLKTAIEHYLRDNPNSTAKEVAEGLDNFSGTPERISNVLRTWAGRTWQSDGAKRNAKWVLLTGVSNPLERSRGENPYRVSPTPITNGVDRNKGVSNRLPYKEDDGDLDFG